MSPHFPRSGAPPSAYDVRQFMKWISWLILHSVRMVDTVTTDEIESFLTHVKPESVLTMVEIRRLGLAVFTNFNTIQYLLMKLIKPAFISSYWIGYTVMGGDHGGTYLGICPSTLIFHTVNYFKMAQNRVIPNILTKSPPMYTVSCHVVSRVRVPNVLSRTEKSAVITHILASYARTNVTVSFLCNMVSIWYMCCVLPQIRFLLNEKIINALYASLSVYLSL